LNSENKGFSVTKDKRGVESGESSVNKGTVNEVSSGVKIHVEVPVVSSGEGWNGDGVVNSVNNDNCEDPVKSNNVNGNDKPNIDVTKKSFTDVTSSNAVKVENKLMVIPTEIDSDGNELVIFDEEMFDVDIKRWELIIYGYFVGYQMSVTELKYNMKRMWGKHGLKEVIDNRNGIFMFKFSRAEGMSFVLDNGPCNVPFEAWTTRGISALASRIGKPLIMDAITANMCHAGMASNGFAKVLIEVNAEKDLPTKIDVAYKNKLNEIIGTKIVHVSYSWKPPSCKECKVFEHCHENCLKNENRKVSEQVENEDVNKSSKGSDGFTKVKNKKGGKQRNRGGQIYKEVNVENDKMKENNKKNELPVPKSNQTVVPSVNMKGMGPKLNSGGNTPKSKKDAAKKGIYRNMNQFDVLMVHDEREQPTLNVSNGMKTVNGEKDIEEDDVFMGQSGMAVSMEENEVTGSDTNVLHDC
ncbi:zinc knuckle CX2CX4HX4C containing protein, partial [Tanacetum coccineum]